MRGDEKGVKENIQIAANQIGTDLTVKPGGIKGEK